MLILRMLPNYNVIDFILNNIYIWNLQILNFKFEPLWNLVCSSHSYILCLTFILI